MKKVNIYVITNIKYKIFLCLIVLIFIIAIVIYIKPSKSRNIIIETNINTNVIKEKKNKENANIIEETRRNNTKEKLKNEKEIQKLREYENMPRSIDGYKVIGQIIIPKINIEKNILEKTTKKALKKSVTKICGPEINKPGNFCIAGHNYSNIFGKINLLEIGDEIDIKDTYDRILKYQVYKKEIVLPDDISCLSQDTYDEKEITLITCTIGARKRIIIKAIEIYD